MEKEKRVVLLSRILERSQSGKYRTKGRVQKSVSVDGMAWICSFSVALEVSLHRTMTNGRNSIDVFTFLGLIIQNGNWLILNSSNMRHG